MISFTSDGVYRWQIFSDFFFLKLKKIVFILQWKYKIWVDI